MQIYMDDIIIYSEDENTGMKYIEKVVKVAENNGLELNWKKLKFLQRKVEFLGMLLKMVL